MGTILYILLFVLVIAFVMVSIILVTGIIYFCIDIIKQIIDNLTASALRSGGFQGTRVQISTSPAILQSKCYRFGLFRIFEVHKINLI